MEKLRIVQLAVFVFVSYGILYVYFESLYNAIAKSLGFYNVFKDGVNESNYALWGYSSMLMTIVGSVVGGSLWTIFYFIPIFRLWYMIFPFAIIAGIIITIYELIFGLLLNRVLNLKLWDYSNEPVNFKGQISLFRSIAWICIGFLMWLINIGLYKLFV